MKSIVRCILMDDDLNGLEYLKLLCEKIESVEIVKCFSDPTSFLSAKDRLEYDVFVTDIDMPVLNGLQIAQLLPGKDIIFVTAHSRFAADAFDLDAVDFVRKPVQLGRLEKAIEKVRDKKGVHAKKDMFCTFLTDKGKMLVPHHEIAFVSTPETEKRDKVLYTVDNAEIRLKNITLAELLSMLPSSFIQVNKREIVALHSIKTVASDEIFLKLEKSGKPVALTLGYKFKAPFLEAIK